MNFFWRHYWRELLRLFLLALPVLVFAGVGVYWLIKGGFFLEVCIALAVTSAATILLTWSIRRKDDGAQEVSAEPVRGLAEAEQSAARKVSQLAAEAQNKPPQNLDELKELARHVIDSVAHEFHGGSRHPLAQFTLPEILFAIEVTAHNLRVATQERLPGSDLITLASVFELYDIYMRGRPVARLSWQAYRLVRAVLNPVQAAVQEASGLAQNSALKSSTRFLSGRVAYLLVEELGRSAVELYAGRYRITEEEARHLIRSQAPQDNDPIPVRILLAGQVNAGKSSLTNALLGAVRAPVSEAPTPGGVRAFRMTSDPDLDLDLVILDTPGIGSTAADTAILEQCDQVDLIVWVAKINQPARDADVRLLEQVRKKIAADPSVRPPAMLLVVTHVDQLSPVREWCPPYDLEDPASPKAVNIGQASRHIAETLAFTSSAVVPVAMPPGQPAYNIDTLWAVIAQNMTEAQLTALDRQLRSGQGFSAARLFSQFRKGGRFLFDQLSPFPTVGKSTDKSSGL